MAQVPALQPQRISCLYWSDWRRVSRSMNFTSAPSGMPCASRVTVTPGKRRLTRLLTSAPVFPLPPWRRGRGTTFTHLPFFQTLGEPIEFEAFGAQVVERSQQAAQNEVAALVERALFQREHTVPFRDHTQQRVVAFLVRTDAAGIGFRQRPAAGAQPQVVAQVVDALAEPPRFGFRPLEQRHGHAHGRFRPKAGQPGQLFHERFSGSGIL